MFVSRLLLILVLLSGVPAHAAAPVILILGDSLSSGYGLNEGEGWTDLLQQRLSANGYPHRVVNASASGDTTAIGLNRITGAMAQYRPVVVVVELGGNDGLRALPVATVQANLLGIIDKVREAGAKVLLAGMRLPPNYGPVYVNAFEAMYRDIATTRAVALIPFLLDGVATVPGMMQDDGIHPGAQAQPLLLDNVWRHLVPLL